MMEGLVFFSICCCCTLMCKDEEWILRHNTHHWKLQCQFLWLFTAWQKSRRFVQQTVQEVCLNPKHLLSKQEKKRKKQNAIIVFLLKAKVWFCVVYLFFFSTVLGLCECQHVLWHMVFPNRNWPSSPLSSSSSPGGFKSQDNLLLLPNSPLKFHLLPTVKLSLVLL